MVDEKRALMADHDNRYEDVQEWQTCGKHCVTFHIKYGCWLCKNDAEREAELNDPHYNDFIPGYATEMDWMSAQEADDYRDEN
jgi:hypothetical protein